jgi:D-sedoheptulose 7-phosphate isomerase
MESIKNLIASSINTKQQLLKDERLLNTIAAAVDVIVNAFRDNKRIYFCGNGGSAADAQHLAAEFSGRFYKNRKALPAEALHCNTSYLTAVANDYSFDDVYSRLIDGIGEPGDILVGLSTSGNSNNMVQAFETARKNQLITIGLTGETGGKMKSLSDFLINISLTDNLRIKKKHIIVKNTIFHL